MLSQGSGSSKVLFQAVVSDRVEWYRPQWQIGFDKGLPLFAQNGVSSDEPYERT